MSTSDAGAATLDRPALSEPLGHLVRRTVIRDSGGTDELGSATEPPLSTGLTTLDEVLGGGLWRGHLTLVAGRAMAGTSLLALTVARAAAVSRGEPTLLVTPDTTAPEVALRIVAAEARVPLNHLRQEALGDDDRTKVQRAESRLMDAPLYLDDIPAPSFADIGDAVAELETRRPRFTRLLVVDHLQALKPGRLGSRRSRELEETALALKRLARERHLSVVLVSRLTSPVPTPDRHGSDPAPNLRDLGDARPVLDIADEVVLVHRDELANSESLKPGEMDLLIAKHRHGTTHRVATVAFQGHYALLVDMVH
jgi:replicative DNA helicase